MFSAIKRSSININNSQTCDIFKALLMLARTIATLVWYLSKPKFNALAPLSTNVIIFGTNFILYWHVSEHFSVLVSYSVQTIIQSCTKFHEILQISKDPPSYRKSKMQWLSFMMTWKESPWESNEVKDKLHCACINHFISII